MSLISGFSSVISNIEPLFDFSAWKEVLLVSSVALTAIGALAQIFGGSFFSFSFYALLCTASCIGHEANQTVKNLEIREKYYQTLKSTTEELSKQCEKFSSENKILAQNNEDLENQVRTLTEQVEKMNTLLTQLEESASLTQKLLTSCIDVSSDQKQTELRIHRIVERLEQNVELQQAELSKTLAKMALQIRKFFLKEAKGALLLGIKKEFLETEKDLRLVQKELERVQKELTETSNRLKKTSQKIEQETKGLVKEQEKLSYLKGLASRVLLMLQNHKIFQSLSSRDQQNAINLQSYYQRGADFGAY